MQQSLQRFATVVTARASAAEQQEAVLADRLHVLATRLDTLLGEFWTARR
jgi:uncharacterized protein involved in exopolysaccharide biosynthesis